MDNQFQWAINEMGRKLGLAWPEVLGCKCSLLSLRVKLEVHWNLQKFHHWLHRSQYIVLDIYLAFTFITAPHGLQLSSIILWCPSSFFLFPFFLFFTFCPPSFSRPVYLTVVKNYKETGRCPLWVLGVLNPPSPSQGQQKPLHWPQKCGAPVWAAPSSHQPDKGTASSWVHLSLPALWVPQGTLSPSLRNKSFVLWRKQDRGALKE